VVVFLRGCVEGAREEFVSALEVICRHTCCAVLRCACCACCAVPAV